MLFRLSCGRLLEIAVSGLPLAAHSRTQPRLNILYHHGWPSTRHEAAFLHPHAQALGLRVISINRPGIGRSTLNPAYSFESVVDDVRQLLDGLGLQRVVFMGTSGGGPYACACASLLPERTSGLCLVASMTHTRNAPGLLRGMALSNRLGYLAINHAPLLVGTAMAAGTALLRFAGSVGIGPTRPASTPWTADFEAASIHGGKLLNDRPGAATSSAWNAGCAGGGSGKDSNQAGNGGDDRGGVSDQGSMAARTGSGAMAAPPADAAAAVPDATGRSGRQVATGLGLSTIATSAMLMAAGFPAVDRAAVVRHMREQPELAALMAGAGQEVLVQGLQGLWQDMRLTSEPWGLPLGAIRAPTFVWQGDQDLNVTEAMARHLAAAIPGAAGRVHLVRGAGHISLGLDHGREVLRMLVQALGEEGEGPVAAAAEKQQQ